MLLAAHSLPADGFGSELSTGRELAKKLCLSDKSML
jgi:hypothetical protein